MKVLDISELKPPRFTRTNYQKGLNEITAAIEGITGERLVAWHRLNGKESDKSVSKAVNGLILGALVEMGWERDWSYCPSVKSNHSTFEASKSFDQGKSLRFAMDVASRHSNEALGYLVKGQLAKKRSSPKKFGVDAHVLLTFTEECLSWGRWNSAVYSYEKFIKNIPLVEGDISTPIWIIAIGPPDGVEISESIAGTLRIENVN
tara:strand:- start:3254 stop:3868 length:615 start_codon:yes stop_codon:yes gene_type:complete